MEEPVKHSEIVEREYSQAIMFGFGGLVSLLLMFIFFRYGGTFSSFAYLFLLAWLGLWGYTGWRLYQIRSIPSYALICPFCKQETVFTSAPTADFSCEHCLRRVPVENGQVLEVFALRCPHCGSVQQLSARAAVALCEECNHEIVLARAERVHVHHFAAHDDSTMPCDLILKGVGRDPEPVIHVLQSMLTLNRHDVKKILEQLPVVLVSNAPKRKAEFLKLQLMEAGAQVEVRPVQNSQTPSTPTY